MKFPHRIKFETFEAPLYSCRGLCHDGCYLWTRDDQKPGFLPEPPLRLCQSTDARAGDGDTVKEVLKRAQYLFQTEEKMLREKVAQVLGEEQNRVLPGRLFLYPLAVETD